MDEPIDPAERIKESVLHALRLVGPGDPAVEHVGEDDTGERPAAA